MSIPDDDILRWRCENCGCTNVRSLTFFDERARLFDEDGDLKYHDTCDMCARGVSDARAQPKPFGDYRTLLLKYICHVGSEEGVDFIRRDGGPLAEWITQDEAAELARLAEESEGHYNSERNTFVFEEG